MEFKAGEKRNQKGIRGEICVPTRTNVFTCRNGTFENTNTSEFPA